MRIVLLFNDFGQQPLNLKDEISVGIKVESAAVGNISLGEMINDLKAEFEQQNNNLSSAIKNNSIESGTL